ncbi:MAG: transcriptional regulator [Bacteroidales bacterium]|nr:transcriptional regulator [Bacteroidales bacterium]
MDTTINQRIKEVADKLCDGNISELARIVGVKQPTLRDIVTGRQVKPGFDILNKIVDNSTLNINSEWLLTGKGEMQTSKIDIVHNPPYRDVGSGVIPIYDISAAANLKTLFANENMQHVLGEIKVPNAPDCDGAIYVRGDSMYPLIKTGDLVSYKQLHSIESVISGEMYVVDFQINGDDFLVVKYVQREEESDTLRLVSYNEHHKDIVIPAGDVRAIALVKIIIRITSIY